LNSPQELRVHVIKGAIQLRPSALINITK
jgi:hypothetical protein